jgi:hypothetical protein
MANGKMRRMVSPPTPDNPQGEVWEIDPSEVPKAIANKFVDFGSPEHMAQLGVPGPEALSGRTNTTRGPGTGLGTVEIKDQPNDFTQQRLEASQPFIGAGKKLANTGLSLSLALAKLPGLNRIPALQSNPEQEAADRAKLEPEGVGQVIGGVGEQMGEMLLPGAAGERLAATLPKARLTAQQVLAANRSPILRNMLMRGAVKTGVDVLGTGAVNKLQGGSFTTGALMGAGGSAYGKAVEDVAPAVKEFMAAHPKIADRLAQAGSYGLVGGGIYGMERHGLAKTGEGIAGTALAALLLHPKTAPLTARILTRAGLATSRTPLAGRIKAHMGMVSSAEGAGYR